MFSYRHAFHAGNHADVLKHATLIAILNHMLEKDAALTVIDTHAGAGLYRLDGDYAQTSGESVDGVKKLIEGKKTLLSGVNIASLATKTVAKSAPKTTPTAPPAPVDLAPLLQNYLDVIAEFNKGGSSRVYPGSPFMMAQLLRDHDKLKLFELHPTDAKTLAANIAQLHDTHRISRCALFDQFPFTHHMESGVLLERR